MDQFIDDRLRTASDVGIDIYSTKARKILEDISIPLDAAILLLAPEGGVALRKRRFAGNYGNLHVEKDSTGVFRSFVTSSGQNDSMLSEGVDSDRRSATLPPLGPLDPLNAFLAYQRSTTQQMDDMKRSLTEQMEKLATLVQPKENKKGGKSGGTQIKNEWNCLETPPLLLLVLHIMESCPPSDVKQRSSLTARSKITKMVPSDKENPVKSS